MKLTFLPFLLMLALLNSCIELEISAPGFPAMAQGLGASAEWVALTLSYNLLGFCLAALVYGPLSDRYGRRKIMLIGNSILTLGAVACVFAPTIQWLLAARFIQGIGAATSAVVVSAIIADRYHTQQAAKLYGLMNAVFTTLMAISPLLGGLINSYIGWRGNYGVVALICLVSLLLLYLFLPETKRTLEKIKVNRFTADYKKLLSSPLFLRAAVTPSLFYGCYMAFVAIAPFIYMGQFNLSMTGYTLCQGAVIASFAVASMIANKIATLFTIKKTLLGSSCLALVASALIATAHDSLMLTLAMSLFSLSSALIYPIIFTRSLEIFPEIKGTASSAIMGLRYLICSGITGTASYFYQGDTLALGLLLFTTAFIAALLIHKINFTGMQMLR